MAKITAVTPTICRLMEIRYPEKLQAKKLPQVIGPAKEILAGRPVQKCLIYAPDALGSFLLEHYSDEFKKVAAIAPIVADLEAVMLSYTPVCFASMFSGALPETTGIRKYEKPVLQIETLFDVLEKDDKRVAIVAVRDSSIDIIFRGRRINYYSEAYDNEATERAIELMEKDEVDFILLYNQEYDDLMHRSHPFSDQAIKAMHNHLATFQRLAEVFNRAWANHDRVIAFTPDHGAHFDKEKNMGNHGTDMPEDLNVRHYWGIFSGK